MNQKKVLKACCCYVHGMHPRSCHKLIPCRPRWELRQMGHAQSVHLHSISVCNITVLGRDTLSFTAALSKVELTSCCIAAAAVFDTTDVLLLYRRKQT